MLNIKTDSRKVRYGDIFVAIKGYRVDGHDFINDAINNGAIKIISEKEIECKVDIKIVKDTKKYLCDYLVKNYSRQLKSLKIIGITGTNGKTTTCYLIYQMLQVLGASVAYIGTTGFFMNDKHMVLKNTTPDILEIYNLLLQAKDNGCTIIVMEVSSHALDQKRIAGITFDVAGFTNLSLDHLDYHKTMEEYLKAKVKILNYLKEDGVMIVNSDDEYHQVFVDNRTKLVGYNSKDYQIKDYLMDIRNTIIKFKYDQEYFVITNLISKFNIYNYLIALSIVNNLGYSIPQIIKISRYIKSPLGRCTIIPIRHGSVVIDFAHSPDAVKKIIESFSENKRARVITIIGCGGDRDHTKRPIMGDIATKLSDYVIFTNDNPRTENPDDIINDIVKNITINNYKIIKNRKLAIKLGLDMIKENDIVLLLGKGHEDYQIIGNDKIHYSDIEEVENYLKR